MTDEMPIRDQNASQASWSDRAFQVRLPNEWIVHTPAEDLGIDRRIEIIDGTRPTGLFFNVQLKSKRTGSGERPYDAIKRSTLNYWEAMSEPTLVVIAHEPSQRVWYQWAHLLPHDENPTTKSRQVRCEREWDALSSSELREETKAFRMARELSAHVPVPVLLTGSTFYGEPIAHFRVALNRKLSTLSSYVRVVSATKDLPRFEVAVEDQRTMVRVAGTRPRQLTWEFRGARSYENVAADVIAALGMAAATAGAEVLSVRLFKVAAPESHMLLAAIGLPYAIAALTRSEENEAVMTLMRRTIFVENSPNGGLALAALGVSGPDPVLRRSVAFGLRDSARAWSKPAVGLYNAANVLGSSNAKDAIELYDEAARNDPRYLERGYWWREKGTCLWDSGDTSGALKCYSRATQLGDSRALAFRADVLMRTGQYREARDTFSRAAIFTKAQDAQWRLSLAALEFIIDELQIPDQNRSGIHASDFDFEPTSDLKAKAIAALELDALNADAHFALDLALWKVGEERIGPAIAAAVISNVNSFGWFNLLVRAAQVANLGDVERAGIAFDAMTCAWNYIGVNFIDAILQDEALTEVGRSNLLDLFEAASPEAAPYEMRLHHNDGGYESVFIPTTK